MGNQDNNSSSSEQTKDGSQPDIKPVINFETGAGALANLNQGDPTAVLAFAAAAQAAGAASADSVAGPSQPTHASGLAIEDRRRYSCPICGRLFTAKNNMKRHLQVHQSVRIKHTCPLCEKRFSWEQDLKVHIRMRHPEQLVSSLA